MTKHSGKSITPIDQSDSQGQNIETPREIPARRGFSVSYRGKTLLSRIDPISQGERLAAEIPLNERTLYFCPSPLYGYGLSLVLEKLPEDSAILCAEADDCLFEISEKALSAISFPSQGENPMPLALARVKDPESLCAFVRKTWGERQFRRLEVIRLTGGWQVFPHLYEDCANTLRREIALEWGNAMTLIRLGRLYSRNLIRNLTLLHNGDSIAALDYGPSPVLALGAGPSLDILLDELCGISKGAISLPAQRRFRIICADTCLPALHDRGIIPDLVVILESQHWNLRDFSGGKGRPVDAAIDLSALPASTRILGGNRFFFATPWTQMTLFSRLSEAGLLPETLPPMGSVGLSTVALALRISTGPVLSGGIDFSFTLDSYHARSTPAHSELSRSQNRLKSVVNAGAAFREGVFTAFSKTGKPIRSDPALRNYRDLFEREFGGNDRLMDIEGPGLDLGVKVIPLAQACGILLGGEAAPLPPIVPAESAGVKGEKLAAFINREMGTLIALRDMLSGKELAEGKHLDELLDYANYLWAHFPDCAGRGGRRPPATDLSFLKRVRTEIDPFLELWEMALGELEEG